MQVLGQPWDPHQEYNKEHGALPDLLEPRATRSQSQRIVAVAPAGGRGAEQKVERKCSGKCGKED